MRRFCRTVRFWLPEEPAPRASATPVARCTLLSSGARSRDNGGGSRQNRQLEGITSPPSFFLTDGCCIQAAATALVCPGSSTRKFFRHRICFVELGHGYKRRRHRRDSEKTSW